MSYTPRPRPSFVDHLERISRSGAPRWKSQDNRRIYEYDGEHGGELEVYDRRGYHLGTADILTGEVVKPAVRGRRIDV